ncbi:lactate utilization protein [Suipraeoptans intestinalis]|uniref:Lactate utilization protein n=1 Tax=Suipraeoptans intestinalis TaxID=2606628 RepID=A0A6N7V1F9_9FIRM|nr:lactate utilization protein [Suipraeoptans intestinalis]MDD7770049.1 lactate utilization protein [Suipraeoptans intestinalis]MDY3121763.1 lactate utilization protein [Suipraeoptans intestinalis]MSR93686.1 lactate utilization protein [Suipraeoptans intestinalis]
MNRRKRNKVLGEQVVKALESRNMEACYVETREEAKEKALEWIKEGSSVSWGGSLSIAEIGLKQAVCEGDFQVFNRDLGKDREERRNIEIAAYGCDYFLTSANGISSDGVLVNMDGLGNRVSFIASGPRNVIVVAGMNKVVKSVEDAISRTRNEAAPINTQRLGLDTPCCRLGTCFDCKTPSTICCQMLITRYSREKNRIKVILVDDTLGF